MPSSRPPSRDHKPWRTGPRRCDVSWPILRDARKSALLRMRFPLRRLPHGEQPLSLDGGFDPWSAASQDGVCEDDEFPGAGDERDLVGFSSGDKPPVEVDKLAVPAESGRQSRGIDAGPQPGTPTPDVPFTRALAAAIVERGDASEGGSLLARQLPEFRHVDDNRKRGSQCDAVDAQDEIEAFGDIIVAAHRGFKLGKHPG